MRIMPGWEAQTRLLEPPEWALSVALRIWVMTRLMAVSARGLEEVAVSKALAPRSSEVALEARGRGW